MHRRISNTLHALRQDLAAKLSDDFIHAACRAAGHTWCDHCLLTPAAILHLLAAGDVLVADRGFCSFAHLAMLMSQGVHAVFRLHQKQIVDFTPGRAHARPCQKRAPKGMPRSRWIRACGLMDQVVESFKPVVRPEWMSEAEYRALPESITVRELRYRITAPGFRTREVTLVTTL